MNNIWKSKEELKECFERYINIPYSKKLRFYKNIYWNIETNKWNSLVWYYKIVFSSNFITIEDYFNKCNTSNKKNKPKKKRYKIKQEKIKKYRDYINSKERKIKRNEFINKYRNKCQCCKNEFLNWDLSLHHHNYDRVWKELESDLTIVCNECHQNIHYINWKKVKLEEKILRKRFIEISR